MLLSRHMTGNGTRWACDGRLLKRSFALSAMLGLPLELIPQAIRAQQTDRPADGRPLAPIEDRHEVWASGVTYLRSREAREEESATADIYQKVYDAQRPELFFKSLGWRVVGPGEAVRIRKDSTWNVPEPEMTLVVNAHGQIVGFCAGNDMSSRSIEGENPLYLPQAKMYDGSCALGSGIVLADPGELKQLDIHIRIERSTETVFSGSTSTSKMHRPIEDLVAFLFREMEFPAGVFLMTGTGVVPGERFTLSAGDRVVIRVGTVSLENPVA